MHGAQHLALLSQNLSKKRLCLVKLALVEKQHTHVMLSLQSLGHVRLTVRAIPQWLGAYRLRPQAVNPCQSAVGLGGSTILETADALRQIDAGAGSVEFL